MNEIRRLHQDGFKLYWATLWGVGEVPDDLPLAELSFSDRYVGARIKNCLSNWQSGYSDGDPFYETAPTTAGELRECPDKLLLGLPNFGQKCLDEVRRLLPRRGRPEIRSREQTIEEARAGRTPLRQGRGAP